MKPALIIGSGPSVDKIQPELLDHFVTFGCNSIYKKFPSWGRSVDNVVITDSNRLREIRNAYRDFTGGLFVGDQRYIIPPYKKYKNLLGRDFTPLRQLANSGPPLRKIWHRLPLPIPARRLLINKWEVCFDLQRGINFGRSVSLPAAQLAAIQGFKTILLTGIDARYDSPKSYFSGVANDINYVNSAFTTDPRLKMEPFFVMLQLTFERLGIRFVDCTPEGALRFIEKGDLKDFISTTNC